jgi:REP element-mobilizing transposase RayT
VKKQLWGGEFWSDGYFASTVSKRGDESTIANYAISQGRDDYGKLYEDYQLKLF